MAKVNGVVPNYTKVDYRLNGISGWYELTGCSKPNFFHLPTELRTEQSHQEFLIKQGARECISGRQKNYNKFFTGLKGTYFQNLFIGDNFADKPSIILFHFTGNRQALTAYYINGYKVFPKFLKTFVANFKSKVIDQEIAIN